MHTTELSAINTMLSVIGEAPLNSLQDLLPADAAIARNILAEVAADVQSRGWNFNRERGYPLNVNATNSEIKLPSRFIHAEIAGEDVTIRGGRLYDRKRHTYKFEKDRYIADIIQLLPYEELPEQARRYIAVRAARIFQARSVGSETLHGFSQEEEYRALAELRRYDARMNSPTMLGRNANILHNWNPAKVLRR